MNARQKLNLIHVLGSLLFAFFLGTLFESWAVFGLSVAVLIVTGYYLGNIRLRGYRRS